ncbi:MAG: hypothetical protein JXA89_18305, partial [Anaerolineae bacterium]|nr:hypothetical protein [Anaerolineae bacterium]
GLELRLFDQLRPVGTFAHHTEHGVDLLFSKSAVIVVPSGCDQLISGLDGSLTLRQIGRQYGDVAVDWVGVLCQEGLVSWASV